MTTETIPKGKTIIHSGDSLSSLFLILKGSFQATLPCYSAVLSKGDVIGLLDLAYDDCSGTYTALEECSVISYELSSPSDIAGMVKAQKDLGHFLFTSSLKSAVGILDEYILCQFNCSNVYQYLTASYDEYKQLCNHLHVSPKALPGMEELTALSLEEELPGWLSSYYEAFQDMPLSCKTPLMETPEFLTGFLTKLSEDLHSALELTQFMTDYQADIAYLFLNENHLDFFDLFTDLYYKMYCLGEDTLSLSTLISKLMIQIEGTPAINQKFYKTRVADYRAQVEKLENTPLEELQQPADPNTGIVSDSLKQILDYADCPADLSSEFIDAVNQYKAVQDKNSQNDDVRKIRLEVTDLFYKVYKEVFILSLRDKEIPPVVQMFLNFGYVDEELAGAESASYLYDTVSTFHGSPGKGIYTLYEWLIAIYNGKKFPSRNEFDMDYEEHIRDMRVTGKITVEEEKRFQTDNFQRVLFEIDNMFPIVNRITFGRLSTFCPVFSEHNVLRNLRNCNVTTDRLVTILNQIRSMDYSAFYRETIYSDPALGIAKEFVQKEVLPDIILMPNIGSRGIMWQEIEGKKRSTPARFMLSAFALENLSATLIRLTAEYRWEMCKRVQGARWNDVSDPSLTSEYFDYLQFYRKNHDLSSDAKEKIKNSLPKAKNSFKEIFVQDYITWIQYEGSGSPRLNKVARGILFAYCPFAKPIRRRLVSNPLYGEIINRYATKTAQTLHHLENVFQKLHNAGAEIPEELMTQKAFLES